MGGEAERFFRRVVGTRREHVYAGKALPDVGEAVAGSEGRSGVGGGNQWHWVALGIGSAITCRTFVKPLSVGLEALYSVVLAKTRSTERPSAVLATPPSRIVCGSSVESVPHGTWAVPPRWACKTVDCAISIGWKSSGTPRGWHGAAGGGSEGGHGGDGGRGGGAEGGGSAGGGDGGLGGGRGGGHGGIGGA